MDSWSNRSATLLYTTVCKAHVPKLAKVQIQYYSVVWLLLIPCVLLIPDRT